MYKPIRALLLAAGLGTRLRPLTLELPKCLVKIGKETLLENWINKLEDIEVEKILINIHYMSEKVDFFLKNKYQNNKKIKKFYEKKLLGTARTLILNRDFFYDSIGIMIHADNFTFMGLEDLIEAHNKKPKNCLLTMLTFTSNDPRSCGIVETDKEGIVKKFHEKVENPPGEIANGAVYVFDNDFLDYLIENHSKAVDFSTEILPFLTDKIYTYHTKMDYVDIGTTAKLKEARSMKPQQKFSKK